LFPKTDTVILCLPEEWVETPVICKLIPMSEYKIKYENMETEIMTNYLKIRKKRKNN
jgi:hypothetical protein